MKNTEENIYFNFSYYALNLLGKQMYTNKWSAISELVANGLDANAKNVRVYINAVNKKKSIIEIFDDGIGMDYEDLEQKYTLIGRNKRVNKDESSEKTKGRKGIGKLAGLFLSRQYYIITKKNKNETAWLLDSRSVLDSEIPKLIRKDVATISLDNQKLWDSYSTGTMIRLIDVDMSYFGSEKLEGLKNKIADYYILDNLGASIEVAYVSRQEDAILYEKVSKKVAFKNFYAFFESKEGLRSKELVRTITMKSIEPSVSQKKREVVVICPDSRGNILDAEGKIKFSVNGEKAFQDINGKEIIIPYELNGWIGIHATISPQEARMNDERFVRNGAYTPNRLKVYVRDKLAVENFLDYLNNSQAFSNYVEGEISFDILDHDLLPDISTTNREGFSRSDERVILLIGILKKIVARLIKERILLGTQINSEERACMEYRESKEREAKENERIQKERERERAEKAEREKKNIENENENLKFSNQNLSNEVNAKTILLDGVDPQRQGLLTHELTTIRLAIEGIITQMKQDFSSYDERERIKKYLFNLRRSSNRLDVIEQQFLKLNTYEIKGKQKIDIKKYTKSYMATNFLNYPKVKMNLNITNNPCEKSVDIFDLSILFENLVVNGIQLGASEIEISFDDSLQEFHVVTNTAPIAIELKESIFDLGVSSRTRGTGIGLYLCKKICEEFGWKISVEEKGNDVDFKIEVGV